MCNRYGPWTKLKLKLFGPVARELFGSLGDVHFTVALVQRIEVSARVIKKRKNLPGAAATLYSACLL